MSSYHNALSRFARNAPPMPRAFLQSFSKDNHSTAANADSDGYVSDEEIASTGSAEPPASPTPSSSGSSSESEAAFSDSLAEAHVSLFHPPSRPAPHTPSPGPHRRKTAPRYSPYAGRPASREEATTQSEVSSLCPLFIHHKTEPLTSLTFLRRQVPLVVMHGRQRLLPSPISVFSILQLVSALSASRLVARACQQLQSWKGPIGPLDLLREVK